MRALIYCRLSQDRHHDELNVEGQQRECRDLATHLGLEVEDVYTDNDLSATTGVTRPGFERLVSDAMGRTDVAIVCWHLDRFVRLTDDLARVIKTGVLVHSVKSAHFDLSTPAGRAVAMTVTAWGQYEGEQKALRQKAANRRRAESGTAASWSNRRPFGYRREGGAVVLEEAEAHALRVGYTMIRDGHNYGDVARFLTSEGFTTTLGNPWNARLARQTMVNPRNAGRVAYGVRNNGGEILSTDGPAIIPPDEFDAIMAQARHESRSRKGEAKARSLLAGLIRCGKCDASVSAATSISFRVNRETGERDRVRTQTYKGVLCGHASAPREVLDDYVGRALLRHLTSPLGHVQRGEVKPSDPRALEAATKLGAARKRMDEHVDMLSAGELSREQFNRARAATEAEIADLEELAQAFYARRTALDLAQSPSQFVAAWRGGGLSMADKRAVLAQHVERVTISPRARGRVEPFDPERHAAISWRA